MPEPRNPRKIKIPGRVAPTLREKIRLFVNESSQSTNPAKLLLERGLTANELKKHEIDASTLHFSYGLSIMTLRTIGYKVADLYGHVDETELRRAGYTVAEMKNGVPGINIVDLKNDGYGAKELRDAGFSLVDLATEAKFYSDELKKAGYTKKELLQVGFKSWDLDQLFK